MKKLIPSLRNYCWKAFLLFAILIISSRIEAADIRVTAAGANSSSCGSTTQPCQSIQYAVNKALAGDNILVAGGTYAYNAAHDTCSSIIKDTAVICFFDKELTIIGGYNSDNWGLSDPQNNLTIIDGQNYRRGVLMVRTTPSAPAASLHLEGFTIQNGNVQGPSNGTGFSTYAFGGGMMTDSSRVSLKRLLFKNNKAVGGSTAYEQYGGAGSGGGLAIRTAPQAILEQITFEGNQAIGGAGVSRGGYGVGGGLYTYQTSASGRNLTFNNNISRAGNSTGIGIDQNGERADAFGGAGSFQEGSLIILENIFASGNQSCGGNATTYAGGAFGGAFKVELAQVTIQGAEIRNNLAQGGNAVNGWLGNGGGIEAINSTVTIKRCAIIKNTARGGHGTTGDKGAAGGGGVNVTWFGSNTSSYLTMANTIVADNAVEQGNGTRVTGGGGGGLWIQATQAEMDHLTVSGNTISDYMQGQGILLMEVGNIPAAATLAYSLVTNHVSNSKTATLHVKAGNTITLINGRWSGNLKNHNADDPNAGHFIGLGNMIPVDSPGYVSPGSPDYNYHLRYTSPVKDLATGSSMPVDIDNEARGNPPDLGADEYLPFPLSVSSYDGALFLSWGGKLNSVASLDHYELTVQCQDGALSPNHIQCGQSLNLGTNTSLWLTGLTNYKGYTLSIKALDQAGAVLDVSRTVSAFATDIRVLLPLIVNQ